MHLGTRAFGVFITAFAMSASALAQRIPTADELMDWAEVNFSGLFPGHQANRTLSPYVYRFYPDSGNYLGVGNGDIYLMGPITNNQLVNFAPVSRFACNVFPESCAPAVSSARGKTLYETYQGTAGYTCNLCHGPTPGTAGGFTRIQTAAGTQESSGVPSVIRNAINSGFGSPPMTQFSALTDAQLGDLAAYINATVYNKPVQ
jgi:mono/diheme cytochrome c family protein